MQVQPYFPEQETIEGNVANARYDDRIVFLRKVWLGFLVCVFGLGGLALWIQPIYQAETWLYLVLLISLVLSATRRLLRGTVWDLLTSFVFGLAWIVAAGHGLAWLKSLGFPLELICIAVLLPPLYGLLCGRDYSFVAQFVLSFVGLFVAGLGLLALKVVSLQEATVGVLLGGLVQFYLVYDLAALLNRRREDEVISAVVDFFRDYLNILTYSLRVIHHWRNFRI